MRKILMFRLAPIMFVLTVFAGNTVCQDFFPDPGFLYDNTSLSRVDITISQAYLDSILKPGNEWKNIEYMASYKFTRGANSFTIDSVGFRLRGNTSRSSAKKSFKVSLNTFISGQKYMGVEKINLNGEHNDPSISRAIISWHIYKEAGVPASRANHVDLFINNEYKGLYANVEHIDEEFLDTRFGNNDGNLYKCLWPASLTFRGDDPTIYRDFYQGDRQVYELKRNVEESDYSDLNSLINILNNTSPSEFPEKLEPIFNVNSYLKNQAVEVLIGHWDSYAYNQNNYYLYHNEGTNKIEFIPYDPDNTFGVDWIGRDWATRDIYSWAQDGGNERPLYKRIMENEIYKDRYSFYMNEILSSTFNNNHLDPILDHMISQTEMSAIEDIYRTLDYTYTYNDFLNSLDEAAGEHVKYGLKPYISKRKTNALSQLNVQPINPIVTLMYVNQPKLSENTAVQFLVEDENALSDLKLMLSDGGDYIAQDILPLGNNMYAANFKALHTAGELKYYVEATDIEMNTTRDPVSGYYSIFYNRGSNDLNVLQIMDIQLYPNPATSSLFINLPKHRSNEIAYRIFDASARVCQQGEAYSNSVIDLDEALENGLYFIEVNIVNEQNRIRGIRKFIINR